MQDQKYVQSWKVPDSKVDQASRMAVPNLADGVPTVEIEVALPLVVDDAVALPLHQGYGETEMIVGRQSVAIFKFSTVQ